MVPAAGLDDVGTDREVLDTYHYVTPRRQSQPIGHPVFRDPPQSPGIAQALAEMQVEDGRQQPAQPGKTECITIPIAAALLPFPLPVLTTTMEGAPLDITTAGIFCTGRLAHWEPFLNGTIASPPLTLTTSTSAW